MSSNKQVVVLMDTTYWGWSFGVVVFKDARTGKILWRKFISKRETLADYQDGLDWKLANGFRIDGVVCDGLRGMEYLTLPAQQVGNKIFLTLIIMGVKHYDKQFKERAVKLSIHRGNISQVAKEL